MVAFVMSGSTLSPGRIIQGYVGVIRGLYRANGKETGNYYSI